MTGKKYSCKLVLLGDSAVGKSCLVTRFVKGDFFEFQEPTIGAAFLTAEVELEDGTSVKFELWDTAGQERYRSLAPMYYRGAAAAIVVYDITDRDSFEGSKAWVAELMRRRGSSCLIVLVGNKLDLEGGREVEKAHVADHASSCGVLHVETSAKTGKNVNELFEMIAQKVPKGDSPRGDISDLSAPRQEMTYRKSCC